MQIKKTLLLAAGLGTRLRPITDTLQKCLVPINGKPLIEYWLENLSAVGVEDFLINTHYFADQMEEYIANSLYADKVTLVHEEELLGTGGTVLANRDFFGNEPFMVVHADNLCFCDFNEFLKAHANRPNMCEITMMLFETDDPKSCGIVELDDKGVVIAFHEKVSNPPSNLANGAVYIFESLVLDSLTRHGSKTFDLSIDVVSGFLGRIYTFLNAQYHRDIGTMESYRLANKYIVSNTAP